MAKYKSLGKEVNLKEFRSRSCTICNDRVSVESYNGKVHGRFGPSSGKMLTCKNCDVIYFYDWDYRKAKYILDRCYFHFESGACDVLIDYNGRWLESFKQEINQKNNKNNVLFSVKDSNGFLTNRFLLLKTYSMPKKRIFNIIKSRAEIYEVFQ